MKRALTILFFLQTLLLHGQGLKPVDLQIDFEDGVLIFKPSDACLSDTCHTNVRLLKEALEHITLRQPDEKSINSFLPFKVGNTKFYLTIYHYPFSSASADTVLRLENDTIMIHDIGADGLLTDSAKEYCIDKRTQQKLDWQASYNILMQAGVCPIDCFMTSLHALGYKGYMLQLLKDGHTAIMYY